MALASAPTVEAKYNFLLLLIPLFPAIGATINAFFGARIEKSSGPKAVHGIAIAMPVISCLISWTIFVQLMLVKDPHHRAFYAVAWDWIHVDLLDARLAFWVDPLTSMMLLIITTIGSLIHLYSVGYMHDEEPGTQWRFFCYLNLFITMMLILVLGDNFLVMFIGWEGVGLASYLLIGYWYRHGEADGLANAAAGMKAFVVNRFGDACFLIGLFTLFWGLQGDWTLPVAKGKIGEEPSVFAPLKPDYTRDKQAIAEEKAIGPQPKLPAPAEHVKAKAPAATMTFSRLRAIFDGEVDRQKLSAKLEADKAKVMAQRDAGVQKLNGDALVAYNKETSKIENAENDKISAALAAFDQKRGRTSIVSKRVFHFIGGGVPILFVVCVLFFLGATAKSAQIPFYVWLPDAMAGPTPVSALIHAATMVTAGVYMIARLNFIFILSPGACTFVGLVGAATALFAASMGLFQYDIKKVLAYSTVSQLGFMFIGVGTGAYWAGVFHLLTHACFKACLFLGSGSVILGCHHEQDMRRMGGLKKYMPTTHKTYAWACLAIAGFPIFAGFCSKDEILWKAFTSSAVLGPANIAIWAMGLLAATLTAFYMYRSYYMTFTGEYRGNDVPLVDPYPDDTARAKSLFVPAQVRGPTPEMIQALEAHGHGGDHGAHGDHGHDDHGHGHDDHGHGHDDHHGGTPHESPSSMTIPLLVLGGASLFLGAIVGFPPVIGHLFHESHIPIISHPMLEGWLHPVLSPGADMMAIYKASNINGSVHGFDSWGIEVLFALISIAVAFGGWFTARWLYKDNANPLPERLMKDPSSLLGPLGEPAQQLHRVIYNKYFVDEGYFMAFVKGGSYVWNGFKNMDVYLVDGAVKSVAFAVKYAGFFQGAIDKYIVDGAVNLVAKLISRFGMWFRSLQTGQIRTYLLGAFGGAVAAFMLLIALS